MDHAAERALAGTETKMAIGIERAAAIDEADVAEHREGGRAEQQTGVKIHGPGPNIRCAGEQNGAHLLVSGSRALVLGV